MLTVFLAHGTLGWADELIFAGVAVVFVIMMGISWVRSRAIEPDFEDETPLQEAKPKRSTQSQDHIALE